MGGSFFLLLFFSFNNPVLTCIYNLSVKIVMVHGELELSPATSYKQKSLFDPKHLHCHKCVDPCSA